MELTLLNAGQIILIPVARSVLGWATSALKDNKVTKFELRKLGETVINTALFGTLIYLGADGFGIELAPIAAGASAVIMDKIVSAMKENKNVTKR